MRVSVVGTLGSPLRPSGIPFRFLSPLPRLPRALLVAGTWEHPLRTTRGLVKLPSAAFLHTTGQEPLRVYFSPRSTLHPRAPHRSLWDLWEQAEAGTLPKIVPTLLRFSSFVLFPLPETVSPGSAPLMHPFIQIHASVCTSGRQFLSCRPYQSFWHATENDFSKREEK